MSFLNHLIKNKFKEDSRWIVKYGKNNIIREVKLLFNPVEYKQLNKNNREIYSQNQLIKILQNDKEKRSS